MSSPDAAGPITGTLRGLLTPFLTRFHPTHGELVASIAEGPGAACVVVCAPPYDDPSGLAKQLRSAARPVPPLLIASDGKGRETFCPAYPDAAGAFSIREPASEIHARILIAARCGERLAALRNEAQHLRGMLRMLGHDVRTPLAAVLSAVELMRVDPESATGLVEMLERSVRGALSLVDDLLELARQESASSRFATAATREIVTEALTEIEPLVSRRNAQISLEGEFPELVCDRRRLIQVFANLIGNAVKYVPSGRTPRVCVRGIDVGFGAIFAVEDNGPGIPPEARRRVFEPFVRLEPDVTEGTGLGLSIVKHAVQAHGGALFVQSRPQGGSEFFILLPKLELPAGDRLPEDDPRRKDVDLEHEGA